MKTLLKLLVANIRLRPARTALTALAVIASSCVVVWVVSGYDALIGQSVDDNAAQAMGRFQLVLTKGGGGGPGGGGRPGGAMTKGQGRPATKGGGNPATKGSGRGGGGGGGGGGRPGMNAVSEGFPIALIQSLKQDDQIAEANLTTRGRVSVGGLEKESTILGGSRLFRGDRPPVNGMPPLSPPMIGTDAAEAPYPMTDGRWIDPAAGEKAEAVLSASYAQRLDLQAGDMIRVVSEVGEWHLRLVGIISQAPSVGRGGGGASQAGVFVTLPMAEAVNGYPSRVNQINIVLREGVDLAACRARLEQQIKTAGTTGSIIDVQALKEQMAQGLSQSSSRALAYSATGLALVAALFIIFTTLSMGVSERARELAVLRAIGLTRGQVAGLVFLEGLVLAILGWAGGLAAGWGLLAIVSRTRPDLFTGGASLGWWCIGLTAIAAVGGAIAASILPAWRATRVTPLDAMAPPRYVSPSRWVIPSAVVGLLFLTINPLLTYILPMDDTTRTWAYAVIGYPGMVIGFVLLAPAVIVLVEHLAGPWVARLLGLPPRLLASTLSANLWRTLGTTIALTVGLGLYIATQTWGYSMLAPFTPGEWVPDVLVGFEPSGLPHEAIDLVKQVPNVNPNRTLAMAVEQPRLSNANYTRGGSLMKQDNVVLIGVDPDLAFGGNDPMINVTYVYGRQADALAKLKAGRACVVPDHFLEACNFRLGDKLEMIPPNGPPGQTVPYEIVAAVDLPGWHWMTKTTGLRRQTTRTGALVFAPLDDVRRDFRIERTNFVWLDTSRAVSDTELEASMQQIAEAHGEARFQVAGVGEVTSKRPYARLTSTQAVRDGIFRRADGMIWGMSQLPLVTLLITSLAVVNTVVSSVRARQWDLGILRAIGTTRAALIRLILAEAILIGLVVCVLGVGFGVMAGWCGTGMSPYLSPFGGLKTPLVLPWKQLGLATSAALGLCLLAAIWPAFTTGRREPLKLLQAGRGAA